MAAADRAKSNPSARSSPSVGSAGLASMPKARPARAARPGIRADCPNSTHASGRRCRGISATQSAYASLSCRAHSAKACSRAGTSAWAANACFRLSACGQGMSICSAIRSVQWSAPWSITAQASTSPPATTATAVQRAATSTRTLAPADGPCRRVQSVAKARIDGTTAWGSPPRRRQASWAATTASRRAAHRSTRCRAGSPSSSRARQPLTNCSVWVGTSTSNCPRTIFSIASGSARGSDRTRNMTSSSPMAAAMRPAARWPVSPADASIGPGGFSQRSARTASTYPSA